MSDTNQQDFNVREYWQILVRRRWMIYTSVLVFTVTAAVTSFLATPIFKATCTVSIERNGVRLLKQDLTAPESSWLDYQNFYNTQYKIIESDRVLKLAAEKLDLQNTGIPGDAKGGFSLVGLPRQLYRSIFGGTELKEDPSAPFVRYLRGGMSVDPVRDSHLVQISFVDPDREYSAKVANALAGAYLEFTLNSKLEIATQSKDFFLKRIFELRKDISAQEEILQKYARDHNLVTGDTNEAALKNYEELRMKLSAAQADLASVESKLRAYSRASSESIPELQLNPLLSDLTRAAAEAEKEYRERLTIYGSEYPEVQKLRAKMDAAREKLASETDSLARRLVESTRIDYQNKLNLVQNLQLLFERSRSTVDQVQGPRAEYLTLLRAVEVKRATLEELLNKQGQMELSASLGDTGHNIRVIDEATPPRIIFKPKKQLNILLGLLFGLFLGVGGAVLMEYVDNTIKSPEDIRKLIDLAVLGMVPSQEEGPNGRKKGIRGRATGDHRYIPSKENDPALVTLYQKLSPVSEAYKELRTAVLLAIPGHPPRDITVTSCQPGEGKTTTTLNLAIALSQLGRRVLVVDTDLRRPRCHQVFRASSAKGVSTYLTGATDLRSLVLPTFAENVFLLPAGPIPPNPSELLASDRFRELVQELRQSGFDHILFDSPPLLSVVDPLLIGRHTEGTILVVKSAYTTRESGRLGRDKLVSGRVNTLGVLVNAVSTEHVPYQYRYYRYGYSRENEQEGSEGTERAATGGKPRSA